MAIIGFILLDSSSLDIHLQRIYLLYSADLSSSAIWIYFLRIHLQYVPHIQWRNLQIWIHLKYFILDSSSMALPYMTIDYNYTMLVALMHYS